MNPITYYSIIYFLAGTVIGFLIELVVVSVGEEFNYKERIATITLWPFMLLTFIVYFIKGFFDR